MAYTYGYPAPTQTKKAYRGRRGGRKSIIKAATLTQDQALIRYVSTMTKSAVPSVREQAEDYLADLLRKA